MHVCHLSETVHSRYVVSFASFSTAPVDEVSTKSALPTATTLERNNAAEMPRIMIGAMANGNQNKITGGTTFLVESIKLVGLYQS